MKLFIALLLVACSSPGDVMTNKPFISYESEKSSQALKECINENFAEKNYIFKSIDVKDGHMVTVDSGMNHTLAVVKIFSNGQGSRLDFYESKSLIRTRGMTKAVDSCK